MNIGVQILIERMKTNPEEWVMMRTVGRRGRWEEVIARYWEYMTEEDQQAYTEARHSLIRDDFTEQVMKELAGANENNDTGLTSAALGSTNITPFLGTVRINTITNQYEVYDGRNWVVTNQNIAYGQQALRSSTANNDINQLQNSYQGMQQGMQQYSAGGGGMLSNIAKNLGFK
jgi:hypothetical protein